MQDYYTREQTNEYKRQELQRFANQHVVGKDQEAKESTVHMRQKQNIALITGDEERIYQDHLKKIEREKEVQLRNQKEAEENDFFHKQEVERVRLAAKRQIVTQNCQELKDLRRAIVNAEASKANHETIQIHKDQIQVEREVEKVQTLEDLKLAAEIERQLKIKEIARAEKMHEELYNGMLFDAAEKQRLADEFRQEELNLEKKMVSEAIAEAMAFRQQQIDQYNTKVVKATTERREFEQQRQQLKANQLKLEQEELYRINQYQKEQDQRDKKRKEMQQFRQLAFDDLLNKIATQLKQREDKINKMQALRIEIQEFLEGEKLKEREAAELMQRARIQQDLIQAMHNQQAERAGKEAEYREYEEFHKNQVIAAYRHSQELEAKAERERRQMVADYREQMDKQLELQREQRMQEEAEIRLFEKKMASEGELDDEAKQMIADERARIIRECATKVFDYMNQGQLTEEDLSIMPEDIQAKIKEIRTERKLTQAGVGAKEMQYISSSIVPNNQKVVETKQKVEEMKRKYDCALPW
eukprot:EST48417.1 hypothetical protein SS50377_11365 [Spironucleus salmonicida]